MRIGIGLIACIFGLIVTAIGVEQRRLDLDPFMLYLIFYNPLAVLGGGLSRGVEMLWERVPAVHHRIGEGTFQAVAAGFVVMTVYLAAVQAMSLSLHLPLTAVVLVGYVFAFAAGFLSGILHGGKPSRRILVAVLAAMVPLTLFAALPPSPVTLGPKALLRLAVYGVVAGLGALLSTR